MSRLSRIGILGSLALALALWAQVPGADGACENDRIRSLQASEQLPDCRAYEQVTPSAKGGNDVTGTVPSAKAALGGDLIALLSNTAGSVFRQYTPLIADRGESAWAAEALSPPPQVGRELELIGLTPDLSAAFLSASEGSEASTTALLSRLAEDGSVHTVVPPTTGLDPSFVGASEDGSLVVFESPAALPDSAPAIAGASNLYAWSRRSGAILLVGVFNDGSVPVEGVFGGSYDWVHGSTDAALAAGGARRDYYTQDQHVVSADGSAIFFTAAGTGQLFLRRNPMAAQSPLDGKGDCTDAALACTIRVSASMKTNGAGPGGTDPLGPGAAAFMGASADGRKAFFTSTEELTNDSETGPDQPPPGIFRSAIDGNPESIEPNFVNAAAVGVAVDDAHIYWTDPARGSIGRAAIDGTDIEEDFISGLARPQWVAVDGSYVYWTSPGPAGQMGEGAIGRARLDGAGAPQQSFIAGASDPQGIAVNDTHVFWANAGTHAIARAEIDGGGIEPNFHFIGGSEVPQGVAVNGPYVYWTSNNPNGFIVRCNLDGSNETYRFVGPGEEVRGIAVQGGYAYWSMKGSGRIGRVTADFGELESQFVSDVDSVVGLAGDDQHLYWVSSQNPVKAGGGNELYRYDADSGELADLSADSHGQNGAEVKGLLGISEDGSSVYFAANGVLAGEPGPGGEVAQPGTCEGVLGAMNGSCNLYVLDDGKVAFIARLEVSGGPAESDAANWVGTPTGVFSDSSFQRVARVAADGRTLLFRSQRQLTAYHSEGVPQLYLYRAGAPELVCVSCDPSGAAPAGAPSLGTIKTPTRFELRPAAALTRNLSANGKRVFFESEDPLVDADGNGGEEGCPPVGFPAQGFSACRDVYEWEADGSGSCRGGGQDGGCLYLLSAGQAGQPAFFADASRDGSDAFFFTRARLADRDRDELVDVYDARVGGGLTARSEAAAGCAVAACRPGPMPPPRVEVLGTEAIRTVAPRLHRTRRCAKARRAGGKRHCGKRRPGRR